MVRRMQGTMSRVGEGFKRAVWILQVSIAQIKLNLLKIILERYSLLMCVEEAKLKDSFINLDQDLFKTVKISG